MLRAFLKIMCVIFKGAMSRYFRIFSKAKWCIRIIRLNSKYNGLVLSRLSYGTETVSCRLLLRMARMEMD